MKRIALLMFGAGLILSSCMPPFLSPSTSQAPQVDLQATAVLLAQATVQPQLIPPTQTILPTATPVVASPTVAPTNTQPILPTATPVVASPTATPTNTQPAATSTTADNAALLTLTATLLAGTPTGTVTSTVGAGSAPTWTPAITVSTLESSTPTVEPVAIHYGTLPPALPGGTIKLINKSRAQAYISLRCTTKDGYVTILEYPVGGKTIKNVDAPAGEYAYEVWIGGKQMTGGFRLKSDRLIVITLYESKVEISGK